MFVDECGPPDGQPVVFLHGARASGGSWDPVVRSLPQYRCLVPDLPHFGRSRRTGRPPFEMVTVAEEVAELIRTTTGRAHLVGHSLGAQVATQLLATKPELIDRAVLCGNVITPLPGAHFARRALRIFAGARAVDVVVASATFDPVGLAICDAPTLFLSGTREPAIVRRSAEVLAARMPNARVATVTGVRHNWPVRRPHLFARSVRGWLDGTDLPAEVVLEDLEG